MSTSIDYRNSPQSDVALFLAGRIRQRLNDGSRVLWLLSGGSGVQVCVETARLLADTDLSNLHVTISDERFGPMGHTDENMQQLIDAGLSLPNATVYRLLANTSIQETLGAYNTWLKATFRNTDYHIALLGVGEDGHTSGIKPFSAAVNGKEASCYFRGDDYERVTTTVAFLSRFEEAVVQAYGSNKRAVVSTLLSRPIVTIDEFPAGLIWDIPKVTLFTDNNKEE